MIFRFLSYIKFLLKSSNQHGVHSPFVYDFVTKGLYKKVDINIKLDAFNQVDKLSKKEEKILIKIVTYFKPTSIITNFKNKSIALDKNHNLLYFNNLNENKITKISKNHPSSFIVMKEIHQNKKSIKNWKKIIQLQEARVTIDLFYFGLIFFRKEQEKEHFIIRS